MANIEIRKRLRELSEKYVRDLETVRIRATVKNFNGKILTGDITRYDRSEEYVHIIFDNDDGYSKTVPKEHIIGIELIRKEDK